MADPRIAGTYRCQTILQGATDLPEDRFIMSTAWNASAGPPYPTAEQMAGLLATVWNQFFTVDHTGGAQALQILVAGWVTSAEIRVYDLDDIPPRVPAIEPLAATFGATSGLPSEVALVSSLVATRNQPRTRGRFYFGPLANTTGVITAGTSSDDARPAAGLRDRLRAATEYLGTTHLLVDGPDSWNVDLAVVSQVTGTSNVVTGGWVDNAFDTQRRRGVSANARTTWGTYTS
jgi:hypothetical protein